MQNFTISQNCLKLPLLLANCREISGQLIYNVEPETRDHKYVQLYRKNKQKTCMQYQT